jgi:hypothetical protein
VSCPENELCLDEGMIPWRSRLKFRTYSPGKVVKYVRFEVLMAVTMKDAVFRDVMLCSVVEDYLCLGEMYCLHLQG